MTLSEYLNMLFPFFGDRKGFGATPKTKKGRGKADFVTFILGAIVEEDWETECPVLDLQAGTLRKILSGASPFSAINAIPFNNHIDKERFVEVLGEDSNPHVVLCNVLSIKKQLGRYTAILPQQNTEFVCQGK